MGLITRAGAPAAIEPEGRSLVITESAVFRLCDGSLVLTELLGDATIETVASATVAPFEVAL